MMQRMSELATIQYEQYNNVEQFSSKYLPMPRKMSREANILCLK